MVMVPPPAQEPDSAWNGLVEACTGAGSAMNASAAAPAAAKARLVFKDLLVENMVTLPL